MVNWRFLRKPVCKSSEACCPMKILEFADLDTSRVKIACRKVSDGRHFSEFFNGIGALLTPTSFPARALEQEPCVGFNR